MKSLFFTTLLLLSTLVCAEQLSTNLIAQCDRDSIQILVFPNNDGDIYLSINEQDFAVTHHSDYEIEIFKSDMVLLSILDEEGEIYIKNGNQYLFLDQLNCSFYGSSISSADAAPASDDTIMTGGGVTVGNGPEKFLELDPITGQFILPIEIQKLFEIISTPSFFPQGK